MGQSKFKLILNIRHLKAFFALFLFVFYAHAEAACSTDNRYWVATNDGSDKFWHDTANWSCISGGPGGADAPNNERLSAIFDNKSSVDAKLNQDTQPIQTLIVGSGYSGTINLNGKHLRVQFGSLIRGTILINGGMFHAKGGKSGAVIIDHGGLLDASGSGSRITIKHNLTIKNGATLTAPDGGGDRFLVQGGFNILSGGTFNHNNGTVTLNPRWGNSPGAIPSIRIYIQDGPGAGRDFYNLTKTGKKHTKLQSDIVIKNNLSLSGSGYIYPNNSGTNYDITIGGNWYQNSPDSFRALSGKVIFNGSSAQTINSQSNFYNLQISNSDVSLLRAATASGTLTIDSGAKLDINGNNLTAGTLVNNGNLQLKGSETLSITTKDTDSGTITYDGTATGLKYGNTYYNLAINSPSGTMTWMSMDH